MTEKTKPIEERIARMFGRTSYCDLRDGVGGGAPDLSTSDVAAAVGMVAQAIGVHAIMALETACAGTDVHFDALQRAWVVHRAPVGEKDLRRYRWGVYFALLDLKGQRVSRTLVEAIAYNNQMRRATLDDETKEAGHWLSGLRDEAIRQLRWVVRDEEALFAIRKARKTDRRSAA